MAFRTENGSSTSQPPTPPGGPALGGSDMSDAEKAFMAAMQSYQANNSAPGSKDSRVYFGQSYLGSSLAEQYKTLDEAYAEFWSNADLRNQWVAETMRMGLATNVDQAASIWLDAIKTSNAVLLTGKKMSPWDLLDIKSGTAQGTIGVPKTTTDKNTTVQHASAADIDAATRSVFQEQLGRDPTKTELARYRGIAFREEARNPVTTTVTTTVDAQGNRTSDSSSVGGLSAAGLTDALTQDASNDPEHGALQAATYYFNALHDAIGPAA